MKIPLNLFFVHVYKKNISKGQKGKPITPHKKLVEFIFYEREFIDWLRKKYKKNLTKISYHEKYCADKYFKIFLSEFKKTKYNKVNKTKREIIEEQLFLAEKFPKITKHEYDIDIVEAYFKIKKLLETIPWDDRMIKKEEYLSAMRYPVIHYCKQNNIPVKRVFETQYPIIVDSTLPEFETYLARTLIAFDINKIDALLSYQNAAWKRVDLFVTIVEHGVYNYVNNNSSFDNNIRLKAIMDWVKTNRAFAFIDQDGKPFENEAHSKMEQTKILKKPEPPRKEKIVVPSFTLIALEENSNYFVIKANEVMNTLKGLKEDRFISKVTKLEDFKNIFSGKNIKPENKVNWTGTFIELNMAVSMLMGSLQKLKKIEGKWETAIRCFLKDGKEIVETQLSNSNGKKTNEDTLMKILQNL